MLGLLATTLIADDMYSRRNREKLQQQIQMHLSQKPKSFSQLCIAFLKPKSNFEIFETKDESHSLRISEIIDSKGGGYLSAEKLLFQANLRQSTC